MPLSGNGFIYQAAGFEESRPSLYQLERWYLMLWNSWEIDPPVPKGSQW